MKTITITQPTRQIARNTIKQLKLSGKDCKLVDNGKGSVNRWNVLVIGRETLTVNRKPTTHAIILVNVKKRCRLINGLQSNHVKV